MKYFTILGLLVLPCIFGLLPLKNMQEEDTTVYDILKKLGDSSLDKNLPNVQIEGVSVLVGEDLVKRGSSNRKGSKKAKRQSKYFVCNTCHNLEKEDPQLRFSDPQTRLEYTAVKGLPFLQGTTFYGVVNRTTFYNDDYQKKYGSLVDKAKNDIREAIQVCAKECSQGRYLQDWELESVLAYLWTIQLKMSDLNLSEPEVKLISEATNNQSNNSRAVDLIKSKYLHSSPAHFTEMPRDIVQGYPYEGNPENGKLLYENSCLHCHYRKDISFFNLDDSKMTFNYLNKKATKYSRYSIYQVIRYGTFPKYGKKAYMPQYPIEKMSDQQVEDLRAYIEMRAS